ncbi:MAG TPA: hypothetical protein V6D30_08590 [Leptolyngbyaceae cyanobacterium]
MGGSRLEKSSQSLIPNPQSLKLATFIFTYLLRLLKYQAQTDAIALIYKNQKEKQLWQEIHPETGLEINLRRWL